jgi:hypothetical protein
MMQSAIYDLMTAAPHVADDARLSAAEFAVYRNGYEKALEVSLRVTRAAAQRFELVERTKRIEGRKVDPHEPARRAKDTRPSDTPAPRPVVSTPAPLGASIALGRGFGDQLVIRRVLERYRRASIALVSSAASDCAPRGAARAHAGAA